jgi:spermidine synthase
MFSKRLSKAVSPRATVEVSEKAGVRYLHLGSEAVQSAMRIAHPDDLELAYTQSMMGFLLFLPEPRKMGLIGLGGGSIVKFLYRRLAATHVTAIEVNPDVIAAARAWFCLPPDDERLDVRLMDGADYVRREARALDVLLLDGFDETRQVEALSTPEFYTACRDALAPGGMLCVNLWGSDHRFEVYWKRIAEAFDHHVLMLPAEKRGNIVVLAFRRAPRETWKQLTERARTLERDLGLPFGRYVDTLRSLGVEHAKGPFP